MKFAEQINMFSGLRHIESFRYYLNALEQAVAKLEIDIANYDVECGAVVASHPYYNTARDHQQYMFAIGEPTAGNLFDTLALRVSYILSKAALTGIDAKLLKMSGLPWTLVDAADAMTFKGKESDPLELLDRVVANGYSLSAAMSLFHARSTLAYHHYTEVDDEVVHRAKKYLEIIGNILRSPEHAGLAHNWGPMKVDKINLLMHPDANVELRNSGLNVKPIPFLNGIHVAVRMSSNRECVSYTTIVHTIDESLQSVRAKVENQSGMRHERNILGSEMGVITKYNPEQENVESIKQSIITRYGRLTASV